MEKHRNFLKVLTIFVLTLPVSALNISAEENTTAKRLAGNTRIETAIKISQETYSHAENVVLAGYSGEADALTGTLIASAKDAPLLLVDHFKNIDAELRRLNTKNIYLLGGRNVISNEVEKELIAANYNVIRVAGENRYETAIKIANEAAARADHIFLTNDGRSGSLADALAVGPVSGRNQLPIFLTAKNQLPEETLSALKQMAVQKITVIGGESVVSNEVTRKLKAEGFDTRRLAGNNRWDTAKIVAEQYFPKAKKAIMTNDGRSGAFADALMGGYLGAKQNAPLLLTDTDSLNTLTKNYLEEYNNFCYVLGGESVISAKTLQEIISPITQIPELETQFPSPTIGSDQTMSELDSIKLNHEFLKYINKERNRVGIEPLEYMPELQSGTSLRLNEMISEDKISHFRPNGSPWYTVFNNLQCAGAMCENVAYSWIECLPEAEILAGERSIECALAEMFFEMYSNSPDHYKNMLGSDYDSIAIATKIIPESGKIFHAMVAATRK